MTKCLSCSKTKFLTMYVCRCHIFIVLRFFPLKVQIIVDQKTVKMSVTIAHCDKRDDFKTQETCAAKHSAKANLLVQFMQ